MLSPFIRARACARQSGRALPRAAAARLCAFLLSISLACWAHAQNASATDSPVQVLGLQDALRIAQQRSYALRAQDAAVQAAGHMAVAALHRPDPTLHLSIDNLPIDGPMRFNLTRDFMTMRSVGLSQTFTREGKRLAGSASFKREADVAHATYSVKIAELRRDTALAWFDRYYQKQMLEILSKQRAEAALQIEAAEALYRADRGIQADLLLARASVFRIDDQILATRAREARAIAQLARHVGELAAAPLADPPSISEIRTAVLQHIERHPAIALLASREAAALAQAEMARQEKHPDWSGTLMYSQRGPSFSNMVSVVVTVPLQWDQKNRQDRELSARLAQVEQARAERTELMRATEAEIQAWLVDWRSKLARLADYDASLIPLAAERTQTMLTAYRGGRASLPGVLEARRMEIDTRVERLRIEMDAAALWATLEYLIPIAAEPAR